ncbi:MAG: cytochrome b [Devosiaceae bacterium]
METPNNGYRTPARLFHWSVAILVLLMIPAGVLMVQEGIGRAMQNTLFIFHKNVGTLLILLVLARLFYRWRNPPVLQPTDMPAWQERIAHVTHFALYAVLLIMPIAGYVRVRAGGFPIESLDALGIPPLVPRSDELASFAKLVHYLGSFAIAGLVAMHIGAASFHGLIKRDGIFTRMWPPVAKSPK